MSKRKLVLFVMASLLVLPVGNLSAVEPSPHQGLLISEIKLGGAGEPKEYIEIFNDSDQPVDLTGYSLEYAKPNFAKESCTATSWKTAALSASLVTLKPLDGWLAANGFKVVELSLNDNTAGSVRLVFNANQQDLVGWGSSSPCFNTQPAEIPSNNYSLRRWFNDQQRPDITSLGDATNFKVDQQPSPGSDPCFVSLCETEPIAYLPATITELLTDPASPKLDTEDEFIELFNPNDQPVQLSNYILHITSSSATSSYTFSDTQMLPDTYLAFYSRDTKLSLVNTKSAYVWLEDPSGTVVSQTDSYPANPEPDNSWILNGQQWVLTTTPTPAAPNIYSLPIENENSNTATCPAGKMLNPETNRCRNITVIVAPKDCLPHQERNPDTGRCRNKSTTAVVPCKPGQVRNLTTNRCRNNNAVISNMTSCQAGYSKNPDTNRCRKDSPAKSSTSSTSSQSSLNKTINYSLIGGASTLMAGYGAYEYRHDLGSLADKLKRQIGWQKRRMIK